MNEKKKDESSTLSVCLIVKDEEKHLSNCLKSIEDIADQIVVVDTGSTDNTVAIAKSFGADIHHFSWCDDFSAARNESIKHATCDWILWIDADEHLLPESKTALQALLKFENHTVIFKIRIRNIKPDGNSYVLSYAHRLFTNHRGLSFSGKIHEQIAYSARELKAKERSTEVTLYHVGYSFIGKEKELKQERNYKLLSEMVTDEPNNAYAHLTLGHNLKEKGRVNEAKEQYEIALKLNQLDSFMKTSALNSLADTLLELNELKRAQKYIERSRKMNPRQNIVYYLKYVAAKKVEDYSAAIKSLKELLKMIPKVRKLGSQTATDVDFDIFRIHSSLGNLYCAEKKWNVAKYHYECVISEKLNNVDTLKKLVQVCHHCQDYSAAEIYLEKLMVLDEENSKYLDVQGTLMIKQQKFEKAIMVYKRLVDMEPEHEEYGRRLLGLYAKTGNFGRMEQLS